jgi:hypothetical protein
LLKNLIIDLIRGMGGKLVASPLATASLWVGIQNPPKIIKWATYAKEWPKKGIIDFINQEISA